MKKFLFCILFSLILFGCNTSKNLITNENFLYSENYNSISNTKKEDSTFSFVLIPDSQSYVDYRFQTTSKPAYPVDQREIYYRQTEWIKNNSVSNGGNLSFAIHLGDFVAHAMYRKVEWKYADIGTSTLIDALPYLFVPGNHDYDQILSLDFWKTCHIYGSRLYNKYFGPNSKYFKDKEWFGGATKNGMNSWSIVNANGNNLLLIGLQLEPDDNVLAWAQQIIDQYPGLPTIITTHEYLDVQASNQLKDDTPFSTRQYVRYAKRNFPEQVWEKLIKTNNQIFMVLCGHAFSGDYGEGLRKDLNIYGNTVYSILTDFQGRNHYLEMKNVSHSLKEIGECGDGWLRIIDVDLNNKNIHIKTYNTEFDIYETDENSDFYLDIDWEWGKRFNK